MELTSPRVKASVVVSFVAVVIFAVVRDVAVDGSVEAEFTSPLDVAG